MADFKYSHLADWLREEIGSGRFAPGEKLPTEQELGQRFSLSRDTVRKGLAAMEEEGLIYKVRGSGTFVRDRGAVSSRPSSKRIGIMMNDVGNYIFPSIVQGINRVLDEAGYTSSIQITGNQISKERAILADFLDGDYAGLIIEPTRAALPQVNYDLYEKLSLTRPAILIHAKLPTLPFSSVTMGDERAGYKLTSWLLNQGKRNICIFCKFDEQTGTQRYLGYAHAYQDTGMPIPNGNIFWVPGDHLLDAFEEPVLPAVQDAVQKCDAVICHDDRLALKVKRFLSSLGIEDKTVCGFDDSAIAHDHRIPSVSHPKELLGEEAARRLLKKIESPALDVSFDFEPEINVNGYDD